MADRIMVEFDSADAQAFFAYAGFQARNVRDPLAIAGSDLLHMVNLQFEQEGAYLDDGVRWRQLNHSYETSKIRRWGDRAILVASGRLRTQAISRRSLRISQTGGGEGVLRYSVKVPYADAHNEGLDDRATVLPQRRFVPTRMELQHHVNDAFADWLERIRSRNARRSALDMVNPFA